MIFVYTPNAGRNLKTLSIRQYWDQKMLNYITEQQPMIVCGDMNVVHTELDIYSLKGKEKTAGCT
jgi:exodeoxyribonuclease-3